MSASGKVPAALGPDCCVPALPLAFAVCSLGAIEEGAIVRKAIWMVFIFEELITTAASVTLNQNGSVAFTFTVSDWEQSRRS